MLKNLPKENIAVKNSYHLSCTSRMSSITNYLLQQYCNTVWPQIELPWIFCRAVPTNLGINHNDTIIKWPKCLNISIQKTKKSRQQLSVSSIPLRRGFHSIFILDDEVQRLQHTGQPHLCRCLLSKWVAGEHLISLPWPKALFAWLNQWGHVPPEPCPVQCLLLAPAAGWGGTGAPWRRCSGDTRSGWRWIFPEEAHPVWHNCTKKDTG